MFNKFKNIIYLISFFVYFFLIIFYYFSDQNIKNTSKSRSEYAFKLSFRTENLPLLENDTNYIIDYRDDVEIYKNKKKKYKFWDLIKK